MSTEFLVDVVIKNGRVVNDFKAKAKYRTKQTEISRFADLDLLYITESNSFRRFKSEEEEKQGKTITDLLLDWGQNQDATSEIKGLFNVKDDSKPFATPKPELLLANIIRSATEEGDYVLDFFAGSFTTCAVAQKLNRRYIGVEQMDYIDSVGLERMKKVLAGDNVGISDDVNWKGGGSFMYAELMTYNQRFIDKVQAASKKGELVSIWNEMEASATLSYLFDKKTFNERLDAFKTASIDEMKKYLIEVLDKNQLYVNYSEIEDQQYGVSKENIELNHQFYKKK
jgi:adenine-specific DNA-methyltransferase